MKAAHILALLLVLPLSACKKLGIPEPLAHSGSGKFSLPPADAAMQAKLQPVIHCINRTFSHYEDIQPTYTRRIAELSRSTSAETSFDFFEFKIEPYERNGEFAEECAKGLDQSVSLSPSDPSLDVPARDAAQAIRALEQPGTAMDAYLTQKGYLADNFSQGRALNATLTPLLDRIVDDSSKLRAVVHTQEATLQQHQLDAIDKAEGHSLRWHTRENMLQARALNDNIVNLVRAHQLTPDTVGAAIKPLQDAYNDTQTLIAQHPEAGRPNQYNNQPVWFSITPELSGELGAANELRGYLADRTMTPEIQRSRVNAQLQQVNTEFNSLVQTYNLMEQNHLGD